MMVFRSLNFLRGAMVACALSAFAAAGAAEDPTRAILLPQTGISAADKEIARLQAEIKAGRRAELSTIRLGWAFVAKARLTSDPGFYKLAELCLQKIGPTEDADAVLLRGHISHAMHQFAETEAIGRKATAIAPQRWQSFALLGDALMEQGKLSDAVDAYQKMVDVRPCLQTYARVAHMRWLKGDLDGAIEMITLAVKSASPRDPEPGAWAYSRLATYQLQAGNTDNAARSIARAFEFVPDFPAALALSTKLALQTGKTAEALQSARQLVAREPLPEHQWLLADVARANGDEPLAQKTEATLRAHGLDEDRRSAALFLATRHEDAGRALEQARVELLNRADVFTFDAVAWAALQAGDLATAQTTSMRALAEGTNDPRLFYHAGCIASAGGDREAATRFFARAISAQQMLLPSERTDLHRRAAEEITHLPSNTTAVAASGRKPENIQTHE